MNIAIFVDAFFPRINGVVTSVKTFAEQLQKSGHNVIVFCPHYPLSQQNEALYSEQKNDILMSYRIVRLDSNKMFWAPDERTVKFSEWKRMERILDEFHPDVLHINTEWVVGKYALRYSKKRGIPAVFTMHTLWEEYVYNYNKFVPAFICPFIVRTVEGKYLLDSSEVIVPTLHMAEVAVRYGVKCPVNQLPTGIPDMKEKYDSVKAAQIRVNVLRNFPAMNGKKVLVYVGRIAKEKNMPFLLKVFETVKRLHPDTALLIVGDGPYKEELERQASESEACNSIFFTGFVSNADVLYYYNLGDIFVFSSVTETQGLVTIEAMRSGLPVVAVGKMGTIDVMQGDHGGFMVEEDTGLFASKVNMLLENDELRRQKAQEAVEWGRHWSLSELTPRLVTIYENAVKAGVPYKK